MVLISRFGNINGPNPISEHHPDYILYAMKLGFDCLIDLSTPDGLSEGVYLMGGKYTVSSEWVKQEKLWIHAHDELTLDRLARETGSVKAFYHRTDDFAIVQTNTGPVIWVFYKRPLHSRSIAFLPEEEPYLPEDLKRCAGLCSNFIARYA